MNENEEFEFALAREKELSQKQDTNEKSFFTQALEYPSRTPDLSGTNTVPGAVSAVTNLFNPFPKSPTTNPVSMLEEKRAIAEGMGSKVKRAMNSLVGDAVSARSANAQKYLSPTMANAYDVLNALSGTMASTMVDFVPNKPSDFALQAGASMLPSAINEATGGYAGKLANRIANRFANSGAPKLIRESRYIQGEPSAGEVILNTPKDKVNLITQNKDVLYKRATNAINDLGNKISAQIQKMFEKGRTPNVPEVKIEGTPQLEYNPSTVEPVVENPPFPQMIDRAGAIKDIGYGQVPRGTKTPQPEFLALPAKPLETPDPYGTLAQETGQGQHFGGRTSIPEPITKEISPEIIQNISASNKISRLAKPVPAQPSIATQEIADTVNPVLESVKRAQGEKSLVYRRLVDLKNRFIKDNGEYMNFRDANIERVRLGSEIGKGFQKDTSALPEMIEAQRNMWTALRNKIGKLSPELDQMLGLQHDLLDVKASVLPEASLGYEKTPDTLYGTLKYPGRSIGIANFLKNELPKQANRISTVAGVSANPLSNMIDKVTNKSKTAYQEILNKRNK